MKPRVVILEAQLMSIMSICRVLADTVLTVDDRAVMEGSSTVQK